MLYICIFYFLDLLGDIMVELYSKNPIYEIIFKINFANFFNIEEKIPLFYEKIKDDFPHNTVNMEPKISININNQEGEIKTTHEPNSWYFHKEEDPYTSPIIIEIGKNYFLIDFRVNMDQYLGFEDFKTKYIDLLINAISVFEIKDFTSIGLRYINKLYCSKGNPLNWKGIVSDNLIFDDLLNYYDSPSRMMSELFFEKNDFLIKFDFGIFNTEFPNSIARKEFILDFDCICQDETNILEIDGIVYEMHETISELFEENVTSKYKSYIK